MLFALQYSYRPKTPLSGLNLTHTASGFSLSVLPAIPIKAKSLPVFSSSSESV